MTDTGPEHDPYTIRPVDAPREAPPETPRREPPRREPPRPSDPDRPPRVDVDALRRVRRLILISALASITAAFVPPLGLALGVVAAVFVWRWWPALVTPGLTRLTSAVVVFGVAFAIVVGAIGTTVMAMFASEMADYASCNTGANTHLAQDRCRTEFDRAVGGVLPGWWP